MDAQILKRYLTKRDDASINCMGRAVCKDGAPPPTTVVTTLYKLKTVVLAPNNTLKRTDVSFVLFAFFALVVSML